MEAERRKAALPGVGWKAMLGTLALIALGAWAVSDFAKGRDRQARWDVGSPTVQAENETRRRYGLRPIGGDWKLAGIENGEFQADQRGSRRGDRFTYEKISSLWVDRKEVFRDPASGRLLSDQDTYSSGRDYDTRADGWASERIFSDFDFSLGGFQGLSYEGDRDKIRRMVDSSWRTPHNLDRIVRKMREGLP